MSVRPHQLRESPGMKKLALAIVWLLSLALVAALATERALQNQLSAVGIELDKSQAILAFNHMDRYRELERDLSTGCYAAALEKARISKDQERMLLASFFKRHPESEFTKYVTDREPGLVDELRTFRSPFYDEKAMSWAWPQCR